MQRKELLLYQRKQLHPHIDSGVAESVIKRKDLRQWEDKTMGGYYRAPRWRLTAKCHRCILVDKSDEGQHTSSLVEVGNPH